MLGRVFLLGKDWMRIGLGWRRGEKDRIRQQVRWTENRHTKREREREGAILRYGSCLLCVWRLFEIEMSMFEEGEKVFEIFLSTHVLLFVYGKNRRRGNFGGKGMFRQRSLECGWVAWVVWCEGGCFQKRRSLVGACRYTRMYIMSKRKEGGDGWWGEVSVQRNKNGGKMEWDGICKALCFLYWNRSAVYLHLFVYLSASSFIYLFMYSFLCLVRLTY